MYFLTTANRKVTDLGIFACNIDKALYIACRFGAYVFLYQTTKMKFIYPTSYIDVIEFE